MITGYAPVKWALPFTIVPQLNKKEKSVKRDKNFTPMKQMKGFIGQAG